MARRTIKLADVQRAMKPRRETPTPEQIAKGTYEDRFITHVDSELRLNRVKTHVSAHSPVERWERAGRLSDTQVAAIALVRGLWRQTEVKQRLISRYDERTPVSFCNEWAAAREVQARKDIARIEGYFLPWQWQAFENVVRFDEPAGVAGSALGFSGTKSAQAAMLMLVRTVTDTIAHHERLT